MDRILQILLQQTGMNEVPGIAKENSNSTSKRPIQTGWDLFLILAKRIP